ncbi:MAG TPA: hypothetical protein VJ464_13365 [Blastocatellia bacterium]|nr:hypothetical protein [Blastocatellia bacterium]
MTQSELEQAAQAGQIKTIISPVSTTDQPQDIGQPELNDFLPILYLLRAPRKHLTAAPTFIPKNFLEQIQFFDDGTNRRLYLYINKTWRYVALT